MENEFRIKEICQLTITPFRLVVANCHSIEREREPKSAQLWHEHKFTSRHIHHLCTVDGCCCNSKQIEREIIQNVIVFFSCLCLFSSLYREQSEKKKEEEVSIAHQTIQSHLNVAIDTSLEQKQYIKTTDEKRKSKKKRCSRRDVVRVPYLRELVFVVMLMMTTYK